MAICMMVKKVKDGLFFFYLKRKKVIDNVYWAMAGKVVNFVSGLLVGIMVARYLGPEQFGLMSYVMSYVTLFSILATFGLNGIEIREMSKDIDAAGTLIGTAFMIRFFFSCVTILLIFCSLIVFESDRFTYAMILIFSLSLIFRTLDVIRNYFTSIILNEYVVKTEIGRTLIGALIKVILLYMHCSLVWFIVASTFEFALIGGGYIYSFRKKAKHIRVFKFDFSVAKMLVHESFPLVLSGAAVVIYQKIDAVMIRNMLDNEALGQFSVATKIADLGAFIPLIIAQTITPLLVKARQGDADLYAQKKQKFMDMIVWSTILISVSTTVLAAPAIHILFGERYSDAIPVLQIRAWKSLFVALFFASGQIIITDHLQQYAVIRNLIGCVVCIILNYIFIPRWGIVGSSMAAVLTMFFSGYLSHFVIKKYRYLVPIQTKALFFGWKRGLKLLTM